VSLNKLKTIKQSVANAVIREQVDVHDIDTTLITHSNHSYSANIAGYKTALTSSFMLYFY